MTYWTFVRKNALRNKRRTALTVLSVGFSLFLLITLQTVLRSLMNPPENAESARRLIVRNAVSLATTMPQAYERELQKIPHVTSVVPMQWVGGQYKEPKNFFPNFAVGHEQFVEMFPDYTFSPGTHEAFTRQRIGAIAGDELVKRFGWKVGDRVTLTGTIFPVDLEFEIVGTYTSELESSIFYFRYDYFREASGFQDTGTFWLMADSIEAVPGIIEAVDSKFRNSAVETKTETSKAFQLGFISMLGNVQALIGSISTVVVFTMLLVAGSTMAMTIRERLREVAILKAVGYPRKVILALVLGEATFLSVLGALTAIGLSAGLGAANATEFTGGFVESIKPTPAALAAALAIGIGMGIVTGLVPALQASRMSITDAMRRLE